MDGAKLTVFSTHEHIDKYAQIKFTSVSYH